MFTFTVALTKDGLRRGWGCDAETYVPDNVVELLGAWHSPLTEIDPDYTLGDLFALLRAVEGIECLSAMLACDVAAFLAEAEEEPDDGGTDAFRHVEVYNVVVLTGYEEDPDDPDEPMRWLDTDEAADHDAMTRALHGLIGGTGIEVRMFDVTDDDPITGRPLHRRVLPGTQNGRWTGPYYLGRECRGWGRAEPFAGFFAAHPRVPPQALESRRALALIPANQLVHLPLRYDPTAVFPNGRRDRQGRPCAPRLRDRIAITFGELVHAVFREVGMLGTPAERDAQNEVIALRMAEIRDAIDEERGGGEPWRRARGTGT